LGKSQEYLKKLLLDESFQNWISGNASPDETAYWEKWVEGEPDRKHLVAEAKRIWHLSTFQSSPLVDVNAEFRKFKSRLSQVVSQKTDWGEKDRGLTFTHSGHKWNRVAYLIAASIAFLMLFSGIFYFYSRYQMKSAMVTESCGYGERKTIHLPDNSTIILNANSQISYKKDWKSSEGRTVYMKGEVYFKVAHVTTPGNNYFSVITPDGIIRVLGTEFAVYCRNEGTRVSLKKGKVEILVKDLKDSDLPISHITLDPGKMVYFRKGDRLLYPEEENINLYLDWWKDYFTFRHTPISHLIKRLEDTYGVQIKVADSRLLTRTLTGTIENCDLQTILNAVSAALQIPFSQKGKYIVLGKQDKIAEMN